MGEGMELADLDRSILVVIDFQGKLVDQMHRPGMVLAVVRRLLRLAEIFQVPVVLTEQYPQGLGGTRPDILEAFEGLSVPHQRVEKTSFGCFGEPTFEEALEELRPKVEPWSRQLVVAGIEAHVCVMQTVIEARARGYGVHLCWDAVSGRGEEYRLWALERMQQAGAVITNHESVGFEWARHKGHPGFKELSRLLKGGQPQDGPLDEPPASSP
jgi:nicotinamidase-related amidase